MYVCMYVCVYVSTKMQSVRKVFVQRLKPSSFKGVTGNNTFKYSVHIHVHCWQESPKQNYAVVLWMEILCWL